MSIRKNLKTSAGRRHLKPYREPHWEKFPTALIKGVSLGFRRSPANGSETWHVRVRVDRNYHRSNLGPVRPEFEYKEAYRKALNWAQAVKHAGVMAKETFTLQDVLDEYLSKLLGNSTKRNREKRRQAKKRLDALLPTQLNQRKVNGITPREVSAVQRSYQQRTNRDGETISPESVNRVMTHLIAALNHGYRLGMIDSDASWKHYERLPEEPHKRKAHEYVNTDDRDRFIEACPEQLRAFVMAMQFLGARPSEIRRLCVSDVSLSKNFVRLLTFKGKARTRDFPLPENSPVRLLFESQIEGKEANDFVFTTQSNKQWTQANLAKTHKAVRATVGLPDGFDTYSWRHCRISDWVRNGHPAPEIADLTATSLEFIQKNYYKPDIGIQAKMACL